MRQLAGAKYRLAWCSVQWRVWPREARRTGRRLVARPPCVDPIERRNDGCEYRDDCRDSEK